LTLTDGAGRQVTLDAPAKRIISLTPSNTEIVYAVGAGDLLVGDTEYCDFPEEAKNVAKIGGFSADTISIETILSLKPDVVLADGTGQESVITALEQANIKVIALNAASLEDVYANIDLVGKISGHDVEAAALVDGMKARVAAVEEKVTSIPEANRLTVFWEVWDEPLMTVGPKTFTGQLIQMAGGVNIFDDVTDDYPQVSSEEVVKRNPAVILGPDTHGDKLITEQLAARPGWDQIDAVKNKKIFLIDGNISSRSGPRIVDALEIIAQSLYPDLFK
jgi:iron complex transport system substrate-binding protein